MVTVCGNSMTLAEQLLSQKYSRTAICWVQPNKLTLFEKNNNYKLKLISWFTNSLPYKRRAQWDGYLADDSCISYSTGSLWLLPLFHCSLVNIQIICWWKIQKNVLFSRSFFDSCSTNSTFSASQYKRALSYQWHKNELDCIIFPWIQHTYIVGLNPVWEQWTKPNDIITRSE